MTLTKIDKWKSMRGKFSRLIWPNGMPQLIPSIALNQSVGYITYDNVNCVQLDVLTCTLDLDGNYGKVHLLHPKPEKALNRCVIVHGGHSQDYYSTGSVVATNGNNFNMVQALLVNGYHVLGCVMPFMASYSPDIIAANMELHSHQNFYFYEQVVGSLDKHPLVYFLEDKIQALNYCDNNFDFKSYDMVGLSGGGWSTVMVAALDRRIRRSYPVFGGLPFDLRAILVSQGYTAYGDYEQKQDRPWWPDLEDKEEHIYALGCLEPGRRQMQIVGDQDTSFPVINLHSQVTAYKDYVQSFVPEGNYDVFIDDYATVHQFSELAITKIIDDLAA